MIKKTLYFGNPCYLSQKDMQLKIQIPANEENPADRITSVPIEDIGIIILDNPQITVTQTVMSSLLENNSAIITCATNHLPAGMMLPLSGNTIQSERYAAQIKASLPLKKLLWKQTIAQKIKNQAVVLEREGKPAANMRKWVEQVNSGDTKNLEARAAVYYWKNIFQQYPDFLRSREGLFPNNLLNYGYAILRAIAARSLVGSGLLPTLGIHHHNRYNAFCLADDIMEPYRPFVDTLVLNVLQNEPESELLTPVLKKRFLGIPVIDVMIDKEESPLMIAMQRTTASLAKCFSGEQRTIIYPGYS